MHGFVVAAGLAVTCVCPGTAEPIRLKAYATLLPPDEQELDEPLNLKLSLRLK